MKSFKAHDDHVRARHSDPEGRTEHRRPWHIAHFKPRLTHIPQYECRSPNPSSGCRPVPVRGMRLREVTRCQSTSVHKTVMSEAWSAECGSGPRSLQRSLSSAGHLCICRATEPKLRAQVQHPVRLRRSAACNSRRRGPLLRASSSTAARTSRRTRSPEEKAPQLQLVAGCRRVIAYRTSLNISATVLLSEAPGANTTKRLPGILRRSACQLSPAQKTT